MAATTQTTLFDPTSATPRPAGQDLTLGRGTGPTSILTWLPRLP